MALYPDAYTKADLKSDLQSLTRRENDATFEAQLERFIWQARAELLRRFALMGVSDFEEDYTQTLADGDTSVAEPTGFSRWYYLWLEDTNGAFVGAMKQVSFSVYQRLLTGTELTATQDGLYVLDTALTDGTPRVWAEWNDNVYLFPAVDRDDLVLRGAYYTVPAANVADQDDTFGSGDPLFDMHDILYEAAAWKAYEWLRDPESANRHKAQTDRLVSEYIKLLRMRRDVPGGEYQTDAVEDR